jgi:hypothetical protein
MKRAKNNYAATRDDRQSSGELLILPDGRVLAHNITPALAEILAALDPADENMRRRAGLNQPAAAPAPTHLSEQPLPPLPLP